MHSKSQEKWRVQELNIYIFEGILAKKFWYCTISLRDLTIKVKKYVDICIYDNSFESVITEKLMF